MRLNAGTRPLLETLLAHRGLARSEDVPELLIAEAGALQRAQQIAATCRAGRSSPPCGAARRARRTARGTTDRSSSARASARSASPCRARGRAPTSGDRSARSAAAAAPRPPRRRPARADRRRRPAGRVNSSPSRPSSSERMPLRNASLKVRPIAIASPTDFICVVSVRSACGNFSKFQRGILTTT